MPEETKKETAEDRAPGHLAKLQRTIDAEPTGAQVLARVIRLEKLLEKALNQSIPQAYEASLPPAEPQEKK